MILRILFFGAVADSVGKREIELVADSDSPVVQVLSAIVEKYPKLSNRKLLLSINQEYGRGNEILRDGDELAIFTAVSGG